MTVKVAYDIKAMRPGCVLTAAGMGADVHAAQSFDTRHWLTAPTPNMRVYAATPAQLARLVQLTEHAHPKQEEA
jgi:hypothetical protein